MEVYTCCFFYAYNSQFNVGCHKRLSIIHGLAEFESQPAQNPEIKLICAVPYPGFELGRKDEWTERILRIMFEADTTKFVRERYSRDVFQIRNIWMVDHSSLLIAAYDGEAGGTKNTIDYALREGHCQIQYI